MKLIAVLLLLIAGLPALAAEGDTLYISDVFYVPIRATGCNSCIILHRGIVSGTQVTDMGEEIDGWRRIRTASGIDGWVPSQFVQTEQIGRVRAPQLEEDMAALQAENGQLQSQIDRLLADLQRVGLSVETVTLESEDGVIRQPVMQISGDVIALGAQNQELVRRNQVMQHELDVLVAENERLADNAWRTSFIYGAVAVFAGALLSALVTRLKKRRGYSEWG